MRTINSSKASTCSFTYYSLVVVDFHRAENFYDKVLSPLGFTSNIKTGSKRYYLENSSICLELKQSGNTRTRKFYKSRRSNMNSISINVSKKEIVDDMYESVAQFNNISLRKPRFYTVNNEELYAFYFIDFEGASVEVYS